MSGYIGKIAAIVTANTSDFTSKLAGTKKDVSGLGESIKSTISAASNSATKSLNAIFTPLQKLQRALEGSTKSPLNLRTDKQVREMQTLVSLSEGLAKPLAAATRQFEQLSQQAQANFLPALILSQTAVKALQTQLEKTGQASGSGFEQARRQIEKTTQAVQRLAQAQQLASKTLTGNELQFRNPRLAQTLAAGAALSQQAAALPADRLQDGVIGRQTAALKQYQDAAVAAQARVENLQLTPNVDPSVLKAAESQLLNLVKTAERAKAQLNRSVNPIGTGFTSRGAAAGPAGLGLFGSQVGGEAEQAVARARTLSAEFAKLPQAAQAGLAGLAGIASRISDEVSQTGSGASQLQKVLDRLQQSIKQTQNVAASGSTALIIRPPDADVVISQTPRGLVEDFQKQQRERSQARQQSASDTLGPALSDPKRQIDATVGRVAALKGQLDSLPASIRSQFIPAIKAAETRLLALAGATTTTPGAIRRATDEVTRLEAAAKRAKQALAIPTSGDFLANIDAKRATGELEGLRGVLSQVGAQAGGPAAAAYDKLADATRRAIESGTVGLPRVQAQLKKLQGEAAAAAAATRKISLGSALQQIQRGGDVSTRGVQNAGLAINQLAFAVDDFFSVTGGAEQRIRALGNNITQFGLIIGQTRGLLIALGAVLAAQAIVGLIRFANSGQSAEDQSKALNEALSRQKSLVEDLRRAFESLGSAVADIAFSAPAQAAQRFSRDLDEVARKQKELRESRVANLDQGVQQERGIQNALNRRLEKETSSGARVAIQRQLRDSERREQEAVRAAAARRPTGDEIAAAVFEAEVSRTDFRSIPDQRRAASVAAGVDRGGDAAAISSQRAELNRQLEATLASRNANAGLNIPFGFGRQDAVNAAAELQRLINALELPLQEALDDLTNQISRSSFAAAIEIQSAQEDVADAIRRGVRGAGDFQAALDNAARQLEEANAQLTAAQELTDPDRRAVEVRRAEDRVRDVGGRLGAINERAREIRLGRTFGGERTTAALSALGGDRFINEEAGLRARLAAAIDAETAAVTAQRAAIERGDDAARDRATADLEAAQAVSELAAAAGEAAVALEAAFSRIRQTAENIVSQSEGLANDAQRRLDEQDPTAPGATDRDVLRRDRDAAEQQLIQDRRRQQELQNQLDRQRAEAQSAPEIVGIDRRLEQLRSDRENAAEAARLGGPAEDPRVAEARQNEIAALEAQREEAVRRQTAGTQTLIDQENQLVAARRRAVEAIQRQREFEAEVARRADPEGDPIRGLDLLEGEGGRAGRDLRQALADINAAVEAQQERILEGVGGRPDLARDELDVLQRQREAAEEQAREDALRRAAPGIFALGDAVQNAILQGPSRAALQATDVSTVEGASELNRLLRGDDAARDQDLVGLQREANRLLQLIADQNPPVAN